MIDHFDTLARSSTHHDVFATVAEQTQRCPNGHRHRFLRCPEGETVLIAYTEAMAGETKPSTLKLIQNSLRYDAVATKPCPTCESPAKVAPASVFVQVGKLLAIQVAWNIDSTSIDQGSRPTKVSCRQFDISLTVNLSEFLRRQENGRPFAATARLCGVLCKVGSRISEGHYVAYIQHKENWWRMDDERAFEVGTVSDAFDGGRYPVFLLYRIEGSVPKGPLEVSKPISLAKAPIESPLKHSKLRLNLTLDRQAYLLPRKPGGADQQSCEPQESP